MELLSKYGLIEVELAYFSSKIAGLAKNGRKWVNNGGFKRKMAEKFLTEFAKISIPEGGYCPTTLNIPAFIHTTASVIGDCVKSYLATYPNINKYYIVNKGNKLF